MVAVQEKIQPGRGEYEGRHAVRSADVASFRPEVAPGEKNAQRDDNRDHHREGTRGARGPLYRFGLGPRPDNPEEHRFPAPGRGFDAHRDFRGGRVRSRPCRSRIEGGERNPLGLRGSEACHIQARRCKENPPVKGSWRRRNLLHARRHGIEPKQTALRVQIQPNHPGDEGRRVVEGKNTAGAVCHQGLRALPVPEIDRRRLSLGQPVPKRGLIPRLRRVVQVSRVICELRVAIGGRRSVPEALDHLARFLRQDLG